MALAPIFFVLLLGYFAGKYHVVDNTHVGSLNTVVMSYAIPASLFVATAVTPAQAMLAQWPVLVILGSAMMLLYPLWYLLQRRALRRSASEAALQALTVSLPNYAAAGLSVAIALLGPGHVVPVAVAIAAGSLLPSPVTLALLELSVVKQNGSALMRGARAMGRALIKPIVLAPVIGTLFSLLSVTLSPIAIASFRQIGQAAGGLALFVTGLILSAQHFRLSWNVALATIVANIFQPLLAFLIAHLLGAPTAAMKVSVMMAALPSGFFGILFGSGYGQASEESGSTVIASTVVSMFTLALAIAWLYG
ncbi:AEC family transporter [Dyella dinghuensis]|uniref:AEC family transporter n=2 Tax=Dyella dinghuensis TaxID=1920169 RepID=A0A432LY22_9GAMM|nr:AEC family transporter [Dyella dinghuensis]